MNLFAIDWIWPAIALAFLLGYLCKSWLDSHFNQDKSRKVSQEYFKGLNFLLNEQPDKAIEVFIKALEVDSETVELHLALGGLFRRKGQVDRATRIHQNLIARPSLTEPQRLEAIYELAQDYHKAGLLDRAENLFIELKEAPSYQFAAIEGLCKIYQQEKDWQNAIDASRAHKRSDRNLNANRTAHYWCELAQQAMDDADYEFAAQCLKSALVENRGSARAVLLQGDLHFKQANYREAIKCWESLSISSPNLAKLVVEKIVLSFRRINDTQGLKNYLNTVASMPKDAESFNTWREALLDVLGEEPANEKLFNQVQMNGLSGPVANFLFKITDQEKLSHNQLKDLLKNLLVQAKNNKIEYTCAGCGFDTKSLFWLCPNCGEWDRFS